MIFHIGNLEIKKNNFVKSFVEKSQLKTGWINGGFFIFNKKMLSYLTEDKNCDFEFGPIQKIASEGQIKAFKHDGFWQCMDTLRDKHGLDGATEVPKDPNEQIAKLESLGAKLSDYTESPEIRAEIDAQVQELNKKFNNPEQVKKFTILPRDLNVDEGELTPTLKIRRKQINENWAKEIEAMYTD